MPEDAQFRQAKHMKKWDAGIVLLGGGGHARVLVELIDMLGRYEIAGILDPHAEKGVVVNGIKVLGNDDMLPDLKRNGVENACIAVGSVKDNTGRKTLFEMARKEGFSVPALIHPGAVVSVGTAVADGVQVMAGAIVQTGSGIDENTIINTGAIIEHDCVIGRSVHICPGAVVCGGSIVGDNSFIGAGAVVIQGIEIGRNALVGAGAVIRCNVAEGALIR